MSPRRWPSSYNSVPRIQVSLSGGLVSANEEPDENSHEIKTDFTFLSFLSLVPILAILSIRAWWTHPSCPAGGPRRPRATRRTRRTRQTACQLRRVNGEVVFFLRSRFHSQDERDRQQASGQQERRHDAAGTAKHHARFMSCTAYGYRVLFSCLRPPYSRCNLGVKSC